MSKPNQQDFMEISVNWQVHHKGIFTGEYKSKYTNYKSDYEIFEIFKKQLKNGEIIKNQKIFIKNNNIKLIINRKYYDNNSIVNMDWLEKLGT